MALERADVFFLNALANDIAMDPLSSKGNEILKSMEEQYGPERGKSVFYASKNKGTIGGVDSPRAGFDSYLKGKGWDQAACDEAWDCYSQAHDAQRARDGGPGSGRKGHQSTSGPEAKSLEGKTIKSTIKRLPRGSFERL